MEKPLYLVLTGLVVGLILAFFMWHQTKLYRQAKRFNFDPKKAQEQRVYFDSAEAKAQWVAVRQMGLPAFGIYLVAALVLVGNLSLRTYLLVGACLYLLYIPARRALGFVPARAIAKLKGQHDILPPRLKDSIGAYFLEVWRSKRDYSHIYPWIVRWLGPLVLYMCLWPVAMVASTFYYVTHVQSKEYPFPHWRDYSHTMSPVEA